MGSLKKVSCNHNFSHTLGPAYNEFGYNAGADPGFPVGGGANPGGRQHMVLPNFLENCMKLRKFWAGGGGGRRGRPLESATVTTTRL